MRRPLLQEWLDQTGRYPVTYFANFNDPRALITDEDVDLIEDLLSNAPTDAKLDLIIESPGGYALSAERLVKTCRTFCPDFRVVVPRRAKSAATMVAMGATKILMGPAAELGPIDPQLSYIDRFNNRQFVSVDAIIKSIDAILGKFQTFKGRRIEGLLMMIPPFDQATIVQLQRDQELAEQLALKWCSQMPKLQRKTKAQIKKAIKIFLDPGLTYSHGRPIDAAAAHASGLPVEVLDKDDPVWALLHDICIRSWASASEMCKAVETISMSFFVPPTPPSDN